MKQLRRIALVLVVTITTGCAVFAMAHPHAHWLQKLHRYAHDVLYADLLFGLKFWLMKS